MMKTNLYKITLILLVLFMSTAAFTQKNLLWVSTTGTTADSNLIKYLVPNGYTINFVSSNIYKGPEYANASAYTGYDALFINEAVGSGDILNYKSAGYPIPCINTEPLAYNVWGWITDASNQFKQLGGDDKLDPDNRTIVFNEVEDNWLANHYEADYNMVWTTDSGGLGLAGFTLGDIVNGAEEIGGFLTSALDGFPSIWSIEDGSTIANDASASLPRMVCIGAIKNGLKLATDEFCEFVMFSLQWVTNDYSEEVSTGKNVLHENLRIWPNPTTGILNFSLTLAVSGNARINIYDITGKLMETFNSDFLNAGENTISLDCSDMANALYYYEIITNDDYFSGKIIKN